MFKNTENSWGLGAQILHWLVFVIFAGLLLVGEVMEGMDKTEMLFGMGKYDFYGWHKSFGMVMLFLVFARISWKMANVTPQTEPKLTKFEKVASHAVHYLLYLAMLVMPLSGYTMSMAGGHGIKMFGWAVPNLIGLDKELAGIAHEIHHLSAYAVYVLLVLHIGAALMHHFIKKDNVLRAMIPSCGKCAKK